MPTYEYECTKCEHCFELRQSIIERKVMEVAKSLDLIVGNVNHRRPQALVEALDVIPHFVAQAGACTRWALPASATSTPPIRSLPLSWGARR